MSDLTSAIARSMADARRAAMPGALGDLPDRVDGLRTQAVEGIADRLVPNRLPLAVAIDGPGLFVLAADDRGGRAYSRLGDFHIDDSGVLVDGRGRAVLGFSQGATAKGAGITPLRIEARERDAARIDADGSLMVKRGGEWQRAGVIALALFPAPERLARIDGVTAHGTASSGPPALARPGERNVGALRPHVLESAAVDLEGDLARLWRLRQRSELEAARTYANDACLRAALDLVK